MAEKRHPGITMHKLSFGGGLMGLVFAVGSALIFLLGFPALWYFVALAGALGVAIAALLRFLHQDGWNRRKPLSILSVSEPAAARKSRKRMNWHQSFRSRPTLTPA
jgi:hypothetical protein